MKLYHGSSFKVTHPDISFSRINLDFGIGFYATSYVEQARNWALRKSGLAGTHAFINEYDLSEDLSKFRVLKFEETNEEWVQFVCNCRRGGNEFRNYDLIIGGVANDKVFYAVDMFYQGLWDINITLNALRFFDINDQWCFVTQNAIDELLSYCGSWEVTS